MKRFFISESAATALAIIGLTTKVFSGLILDFPTLYNSRWICAFIGGLLMLPSAFIIDRIRYGCASSPFIEAYTRYRVPASILITVLSAFDAAVTAVAIGTSASYIAVDNVTTFYLLLPQYALCVWSLAFNGNAIGNAGRLLGRLLLGIIIITAVLSLPKYRPNWLTPLLGPGVPTLAIGSLRCAGWYSLLIPLFLLAETESGTTAKRHAALYSLLSATVLSTAILLLVAMLSPALLTGDMETRFSVLDSLLSNGRLSLGAQLPMIVLWLVGLFFLLLLDAWTCAAMVQTAMPNLSRAAHILIAICAIIFFAFSGFTNRSGNRLSGLIYLPVYLLISIPCIVHAKRRNGGTRHA